MRATVLTSAMTAAVAVVGSLGAKTDPAWYRDLEKAARQPAPSRRGPLLGLVAADLVAAATLTPYAAWCGFANALNLSLWRRNRARAATVPS